MWFFHVKFNFHVAGTQVHLTFNLRQTSVIFCKLRLLKNSQKLTSVEKFGKVSLEVLPGAIICMYCHYDGDC